jgi:CheY-like chemotaxis protein
MIYEMLSLVRSACRRRRSNPIKYPERLLISQPHHRTVKPLRRCTVAPFPCSPSPTNKSSFPLQPNRLNPYTLRRLHLLYLFFGKALEYNDTLTDKKYLIMIIVIADDSSLLRDRIKSLLNGLKEKLVLYEAENGVEALQLIKEKKPDLVILDIRMPEMDGIVVLKKIRELKMKVKVCMLTNFPYPQYKKKCFEAGADYFLSKNEDFEDIKIVIADMLGETETPDRTQL